ncbi:DUF5959 family protein [Embleya hyalina]|uniref:Uncharacterized protein n=1 Tax=Embleya hyalina TaxID=516124 RepID=A0A401YN02_9ACTN|nr:DUF5959 family protein [Embleya hyalina]GCD95985.1 hypothetical protein EHYA_03669 [Embleya hyalina]
MPGVGGLSQNDVFSAESIRDVMNTLAARELIRLEDRSGSVIVRLTREPPSPYGDFEAELEVESSFATVRARLSVRSEDFDDWAECLDLLQEGERDEYGPPVSVYWSNSGRQPWLTVISDDPISVEVGDPTQSGVRVHIPLDLRSVERAWVEHARERLHAVRDAWGV